MKHIQGKKITGYVTILVSGKNPEQFFQLLINQGIPVWDVQKTARAKCKGKIALKHVSALKSTRRKTNYKISFIDKKGLPFILKNYMKRKEVLFAILASVLLLVFLSNIIWDVRITGVTKDVEEKISKQLNEYGIHRGSTMNSMDSSSAIQQQLLKDVPDLLWIGVHKKGTTLFLEGVEKEIVDKREIHSPRNLVAAKNGVINKMYIVNGQAKVNVNDYVERGDLLVSGEIDTLSSDDEDEKDKKEIVAAEGEVMANTWYEVQVSAPLTTSEEQLTGNYKTKKMIRMKNLKIPYWGFGRPEYKHIYQETSETPVYFLKWKLPLYLVETTYHEKIYKKMKRTKEEAIKTAIIQAKNELQLQIGPEAQFLSEKVLHEAIENGKVKVKLYISVLENIVQEEKISHHNNEKE
ncbi:sporulation protein YqfD [Virgibacillus sp. W0181]|uniref:sporulation protein YqfD n=1 Tax=Virgibacillus sp. W0181 TaxID=3391581 RepID=UPI003F44D4CC